MLLAVDVGNTTVKFGLFKGKKLVRHWLFPTSSLRGGTQCRRSNLKKRDCFASSLDKLGTSLAMTASSKISGIVISCVVPGLLVKLNKKLSRIFGLKPRVISYGQIGSDRIVNAVAGYYFYGGPLIVVDFGTAITFDLVSKTGQYLGGIIAPGVELCRNALSEKTALLPWIKLSKPKVLVGKTTSQSMRSGLVYGFSSLCEGIILEIKKKYRIDFVIATGGGTKNIAPFCKSINWIDPLLTLKGLRVIYQGMAKINKNSRIIKKNGENS